MAKGYWIARVDVSDEDGYKPYAAANPTIFRKFGGRFVVRAGRFECVEGASRSRNVVIAVPCFQRAPSPHRRECRVRGRSFPCLRRPVIPAPRSETRKWRTCG
jgi:uncharacterized protein (DUF1330 family)